MKNGAFKSMRNKTMPASPSRTPGAVLLGDAFNMRHPLTGGGMTVAFSDVVTMKSMLSPLPSFADFAAVEKRVDAFYAHRTRPALTINTLANALYRVFCASGDSSMEEMRKACFEYLRLGGSMSAGPIALLGGLETNPLTLVSHFFGRAVRRDAADDASADARAPVQIREPAERRREDHLPDRLGGGARAHVRPERTQGEVGLDLKMREGWCREEWRSFSFTFTQI